MMPDFSGSHKRESRAAERGRAVASAARDTASPAMLDDIVDLDNNLRQHPSYRSAGQTKARVPMAARKRASRKRTAGALREKAAGAPAQRAGDRSRRAQRAARLFRAPRCRSGCSRTSSAGWRSIDISPAQFSVLVVISANPGLSQAEIAATLGIERARLVRLLHRLEQRGLTQRLPSSADGRRHALRLTRDGEKVLARAKTLAARARGGAEGEARRRALPASAGSAAGILVALSFRGVRRSAQGDGGRTRNP